MKQFKIDAIEPEKVKLFGICTAEKSYTFCWNLNQKLEFKFKNIENHIVEDSNGQQLEFYFYESFKEESDELYFLIENKTNNQLLSKQFSVCDFFFIASDDVGESKLEEIQQQIQQLAIVQTTVAIDFDELKQKDRFQVIA